MMERQDEKGPTASALCNDREEAWVDSTEEVVLDGARDGHAIVAALLGGSLTEDMSEL